MPVRKPEEITPQDRRLGATIRSMRTERKLTLSVLAHMSNLSHSFLSQVERGLARPSMESLYCLAEALGTTSASLMGDEEGHRGPAVHRADVGPVLCNTAYGTIDGASRHLLHGGSNSEVLEFFGAPAEFRDYWQHRGEELLYVIEGALELDLEGEIYALGPGDSISYAAERPHRSRQVGSSVRMLMFCVGSRPSNGQGPTYPFPRSR